MSRRYGLIVGLARDGARLEELLVSRKGRIITLADRFGFSQLRRSARQILRRSCKGRLCPLVITQKRPLMIT